MFAKECSAMNLREALSQAFWPILAKWVVNREGSEKSLEGTRHQVGRQPGGQREVIIIKACDILRANS
eukprot:CAMPEP_0181197060 /NCGR_PEP_ID=MMETSP1096-20121128/15824_1 /TAXON_ID=156174 ORGANISM="Chrysochromulina ericina, Strain CCMP281" /NCGR_SAMPLE_ID=MMETSP1096 /ASSEMBLY_ACC=CAM_ASM_000453 /LENGTH=67 /DNA_ID=CAMNT_0023286915 /DNA_START=665 /DNA_END=865 /DNA_ORIENTATION=+